MDHVEVKKRTLVHRGSIVDVYQDEVQLPDGGTELWIMWSIARGQRRSCVLPDGVF